MSLTKPLLISLQFCLKNLKSKNLMKECGRNYAAVLKGERDIDIFHPNDPALCAHQVRVAVKTSAICGTQIGEWTMSRVLIHTFLTALAMRPGRVLEVGDEVKDRQLVTGDHFVDEGKRRLP